MKTTILTALILLAPALAVAEPLKVTRTEADTYKATDGSLIVTEGCTQTARKMTAKIERSRDRLFVVFFDEHGEEEGDCQARVVVKPVRTLVARR